LKRGSKITRTVYIPTDLIAAAKAGAKQKGISLNELARRGIRRQLNACIIARSKPPAPVGRETAYSLSLYLSTRLYQSATDIAYDVGISFNELVRRGLRLELGLPPEGK
jgi:predicted HicB family RNase H-like nuclease